MKSFNIIRHVEIIRQVMKSRAATVIVWTKRHYGMSEGRVSNKFMSSYPPLCWPRTTTWRLETHPVSGGLQGGEVRTGARLNHHHHPHHHHHHLPFVTHVLNDQRLFTAIQSQEASFWWFIVHRVVNSAVYIRKCLTEGRSAPSCTHTRVILVRWKHFIFTMSTLH